MRLRDWRVRTKLAAVLVIPALGFLVVTGVQTVAAIANAAELQTFSRQVALGTEITALVHELQRERDRTVGILAASDPGTGGAAKAMQDLDPDRIAVDRAAATWRSAVLPLLSEDEALRPAYERADASLNELGRVRTGVQNGWLRQRAAFDAYSRPIADLLAMLPQPVTAGGDALLGQSVRAFADMAHSKELTAQIRGKVYAVTNADIFGPGDAEGLADIRAQRAAALTAFRTEALPAQVAIFDSTMINQAVTNANRLEQEVVVAARGGGVTTDPEQWWQASTTSLQLMRDVEASLQNESMRLAAERSASQWRSTLLATGAALVLLIVALVLSYVIGRTMARTLRALREQALDVARHKLPRVLEELRQQPHGTPSVEVDAISIRSSDEIGEVADAFTAVHRSAVRLAAEQAMMRQNVNAMFINFARRSQTLVERQLRLLDTLEVAETDPDQLANLFKLDHLATRMRRNDENLLVLAGSDATRRWTEPVPLTAVVLAAIAEIEQYTRIRYDVTEDLHVVGYAVGDLVHLIAELLDNATAFSPPDTKVTVLGWTAAGGTAVLVVQDEGIGMGPDTLRLANDQLSRPTYIDVAASERMGLVVVSHLADRNDIEVEMRDAAPGLAVYVQLPARLLAPAPAEPTPGMDRAPWLADPAELEADALPDTLADVAAAEQAAAMSARTALTAVAHPGPAAPRAVPTRVEDVLGTGGPGAGGSVFWTRGGGKSAAETATRPGSAEPAPNGTEPATGSDRSPSEIEPAVAIAGTEPVTAEAATEPTEPTASIVDGSTGTNGATPADRPAIPGPRPAVIGGTSTAGLPIRVPMAQLPNQRNESSAPPVPVDEPDPEDISSVLSRFYGGVHRAETEDGAPTPADITQERGA